MNNPKQTIDISFTSIFRVFAVCFVIYFLFFIKDIIFIVFISVLIAMIVEPSVNKMEKEKNIPRVFGAGVFFIAGGLVLSLLIYVVAPPLAKEIAQMAINIPLYINTIDFGYIIKNGNDLGFTPSDFQNILINLSNALKNATYFVFNSAMDLVGGIFSGILVLVMSFYLVLEENGTEKFVKVLAPEDSQKQLLRIIQKIEKKLGHWFMGQIALGFIVGFLSFLGLSLIGVPYALVLAIMAGVFELIPYIGPIISAIPAVIIALTVSPAMAGLTFVLYFLIQQFENYLIVPKVMEKSVGLHPIIIIIAAILGGKLAGIAGMILAVPIATMIFIILEDIKQNRENNS
jgi:predicted PurR-regulated permease PerM